LKTSALTPGEVDELRRSARCMIDDEIGDAEQSGKAAVQQRLEITETAS
jgi:hypothetical protein